MRRILFAPQAESNRDLTYSEEASCCYSLHLLIQDRGLPEYRIILEAFRASIRGFLNFKNIMSSELFLDSLVSDLDMLVAGRITAVEGMDKIGFHLILSTCERIHVLTSDASRVWLGKGDYLPLPRPPQDLEVRRRALNPGRVQAELFPTRFSDRLSLYEIDYPRTGELGLVVGCGEREGEEVFQHLSDVTEGRDDFGLHEIEIKYARNKILAVSFSSRDREAALSVPPAVLSRQAGSSHRRALSVVLTSVATLLVLLGAYLGSERLHLVRDPGRSRLESGHEKAQEAATIARSEPVVASDTRHSTAAPERENAGFALHWKSKFSRPVTSSPLLTGDLVVFGCRDGNLYALDAGSGDVVWQFTSGAGIGASPAGDSSRIVSADYNGTVACLARRDGNLLWKRKLPGRIVSSPLLVGMKVYLGCYDHGFYCLSLGNGDILWKTKTSGIIRANATIAGGLVLFPSYDGYLYALTQGTGKIGWRYKLRGNVSSSPVADRGIVVAAAPDGSVRAFAAASGELKWEKKLEAPVKSGLLMNDGRVVFGANDGRVYSLASSDGSIQWEFATGDVVLSRPCIVEKKLFVGSYDGFMYMLDAATGDPLDRFDSGSPIFSSPAAKNGFLFFGDNGGDFYCLRYTLAYKS